MRRSEISDFFVLAGFFVRIIARQFEGRCAHEMTEPEIAVQELLPERSVRSKAASGRDDGVVEVDEGLASMQFFDHFQVFENRNRGEAAELFVDGPLDEEGAIAETETRVVQPGAQAIKT